MPLPTVAECKSWLNIAHSADDGVIQLQIDAAFSEHTEATGRLAADITKVEQIAIMEKVGQLYGFRGDDVVAPSTWFTDGIRRMFNPNSIG